MGQGEAWGAGFPPGRCPGINLKQGKLEENGQFSDNQSSEILGTFGGIKPLRVLFGC